MRPALALIEEDLGVEGEDPITVAGAVIKIAPKFLNGEMFTLISINLRGGTG